MAATGAAPIVTGLYLGARVIGSNFPPVFWAQGYLAFVTLTTCGFFWMYTCWLQYRVPERGRWWFLFMILIWWGGQDAIIVTRLWMEAEFIYLLPLGIVPFNVALLLWARRVLP